MLRIGYSRQVGPLWLGGAGVAITIRALVVDTFAVTLQVLASTLSTTLTLSKLRPVSRLASLMLCYELCELLHCCCARSYSCLVFDIFCRLSSFRTLCFGFLSHVALIYDFSKALLCCLSSVCQQHFDTFYPWKSGDGHMHVLSLLLSFVSLAAVLGITIAAFGCIAPPP